MHDLGFVLLSGLSYLLATVRRVRTASEIFRHSSVAAIVIAISKAIDTWLPGMLGSA